MVPKWIICVLEELFFRIEKVFFTNLRKLVKIKKLKIVGLVYILKKVNLNFQIIVPKLWECD